MANIIFERSRMTMDSQAAQSAVVVHRVTAWGLLFNLSLTAAKIVLGMLSSSQALIADGVHSLSDAVTDIAVLIGVKYWSAPADAEHPHGHGRIETMLSFFIGAALAVVGVSLGYHAIETMQQPHDKVPGLAAFLTACASIVVKEFLYQWTARVGKRIKSPAMMANAWHHRSDALSSIPVAVSIVGTQIEPSWVFLDNIGAIIVTVLILHAAWFISWPALRQLLDAAADKEENDAIYRIAKETEGVQAIHALRTRHIGMGLQVDVHVLVEPLLSVREGHTIAGAVKHRLLNEGPDVIDVLVHIEPFEHTDGAAK